MTRDALMRKKWLWATCLILVLAVIGIVVWALPPAQPAVDAFEALRSGNGVAIDTTRWLVFSPDRPTSTVGFIFYPGGRVDARAYAPLAHEIARHGYFSVIVPMPLALAVLAPERGADVIQEYPEIEHWVIGGHSLGGAMAAQFVANHPTEVSGLALMASYPAESIDLSPLVGIEVVSIYGTKDGLALPETVQAAAERLPETTRYVPIEGGNHAQFGWYGAQVGDNVATISVVEQQRLTVDAVVALLDLIAGR